MSIEANIVVLGAGVFGLTTAFQLVRKGYKNVAVIAKHVPGDTHPDYTSSWAGANYVPVSKEGSEEAQWDLDTWDALVELAKGAPEAGVWIRDKYAYYRNEDRKQESLNLWWKDVVNDNLCHWKFRFLTEEEVPQFADWGTFYGTVSLDPSIYLHYLQSQCLSLGVTFRRVSVGHIREAFNQTGLGGSTADIVVNCTGLWASTLGGVMDDKVVPMRGQLVIVENESHGMFSLSGDGGMKGEVGECCYIIDRPAAGGTALGGSYYPSWDREPDMALAERIMKRAIQICPQLVPEGASIEALRVIRHQVGLRPVRSGGPRIELETLDDADQGKLRVVHCYGAGGSGFQSSYGMANKAVALVGETLDWLN